MEIKNIKKLPKGTKGIEVTGVITAVYPPTHLEGISKKTGKEYSFDKQDIYIKDGEESIKVSSSSSEVLTESNKGQKITMLGCNVDSYTNKDNELIVTLSVGGSGNFIFEEQVEASDTSLEQSAGMAEEVFNKEDKETKVDTFKEEQKARLMEATIIVHSTVTDETWLGLWKEMTGLNAPTNENIQAWISGLKITIDRKRG